MPELKIRKPSRRYMCDVVKCRRLTHNLIARGDDASRSSLHICDGCIDDMYYRLHPGYKDVITAWEAGELVERADNAPAEDESVSSEDAELEAEPIEVHSASEYKRLDAMDVLDEISTPEKPVRRRKAKTE